MPQENSKVCPQCGQENSCQSSVLNTTKSQFSCWCQRVSLSETARLELKKHGLSEQCLCQSCFTSLSKRYP